MLKILITCAVRRRILFEIKWPDTEVYYVLTGIGKANYGLPAEAIVHVQPDLVVNGKIAGTIVHHQVGRYLVCRTFVDRDMAKLKRFRLESK